MHNLIKTRGSNGFESHPFERAAATTLLAGEAFHEEVVTEGGSRYLRYATPVPVVMNKCLMCHPSWEGNTGNIGSLSYRVPLIDSWLRSRGRLDPRGRLALLA